MVRLCLHSFGVVAVITLFTTATAAAQDTPAPKPADPPAKASAPTTVDDNDPDKQAAADEKVEPGAKTPAGLVKLHRHLWIDPKRKWVVMEGRICQRRGVLEMFACPEGTKEHESIIAVKSKAWHVHTALVAVGAVAVHPVKFNPEYVPAKGTPIDIEVLWKDSNGEKKQAAAQDWVNDNKDKRLKHTWVFGGSRFFKDEMTGKELYLAEDGDLICVSNFTTATMDLPIESTADAGNQLFYANTKAIPPVDTVVRLVLKPRLKENPKAQNKPAAKQPNGAKAKTPESAEK